MKYLNSAEYHYEVLCCLIKVIKRIPGFNYPVVPRYHGDRFCLVVNGTTIFDKTFQSDGELRYYFRSQGREKIREFKQALEDYAASIPDYP